MTYAEHVRDGSLASVSFVGWLASYMYPLGLLGPMMATCTGASDDSWVASLLISTPLLLISMPLIVVGKAWAKWLRWFSLPHVITLLLAICYLPIPLVRTTFGGEHLCDFNVEPNSYGVPTPLWHRFYAPSQVLALSVFVVFCWWFWRLPTRATTRVSSVEV